MSSEIEYFPRGSSTTKKESSSEKPRINRVDRNDLFVNSSTTKRKRSQENSQKLKAEQKKKKKKSLDGEDHQNTLYRRLHKQVRSFSPIFPSQKTFLESHGWCIDLWLYRKNYSL